MGVKKDIDEREDGCVSQWQNDRVQDTEVELLTTANLGRMKRVGNDDVCVEKGIETGTVVEIKDTLDIWKG